MEETVTSTELVRNLSDVLARVRYRQESFVVEKNGRPVARVVPFEPVAIGTMQDVVAAWTSGPADSTFADALEQVGRDDLPPDDPWAS